jgi:hypothetical protein
MVIHMIEYLAMIAAWVGEKDLACEQLATPSVPHSGMDLSYGELKLDAGLGSRCAADPWRRKTRRSR